MSEKKTIVISAVNLRKGGTLTILRDCLRYLSDLIREGDYRVVALVHKRELCDYDGIEYIEMPDIIKGWGKRLWCEYVTMRKISEELAPVYLWLSLHDTSPRVKADRQAVYCQTSFPFYKASIKDLYFSHKIVLFSIFTRFAYRINVHANDYLIVQQSWLRDGLSEILNVSKDKFIVSPPQQSEDVIVPERIEKFVYTFLYPAAPDCHKNFQVLCDAAEQLETEIGKGKFSVVLTIDGTENRYTRWLKKKWGHISSIDFVGYMCKEKLYGYYQIADCLVFPSKVETWGLPISEFARYQRPMLLADLPYAYGAASEAARNAFFNSNDSRELKNQMKSLLLGNTSFLSAVPKTDIAEPVTYGWKELFDYLLS